MAGTNRQCCAASGRRKLRFGIFLSICLAALSAASPTRGGGGPENVFLVVNPKNGDSLAIANLYRQLRQIPASNLFYLPWNGPPYETDISAFRVEFLEKIFAEIETRQLGRQIDYIVYSAGFPYAVDISSDLPANTEYAKASLTGLTYLHQYVQANSTLYVSRSANRYMRQPNSALPSLPTTGFRSRYRWGILGRPEQETGRQYMLSVMLAYTAGKGNTLDEAIRYLQSSVGADGSLPKGTIYYARNSNVRSTTRHDGFPKAVAELMRLGVRAEIIEGILPLDKPDVQGLTTGTATFDWPKSGSQILPGAICDNFTSFGGVLAGYHSQTLISEFLRYGAAGASGTVVEPYATAQKFPDPMIHVHYARGCSLAEAFYQSVYSPYQLLVVGDALCQPWARFPTVTVEGLAAGQTVKGRVYLTPSARSSAGHAVRRFEVFLDGRLTRRYEPSESVDFESEKLPDGYHELRVVAVMNTPVETRGRIILPFFVDNRGRKIECTSAPPHNVFPGQPLIITAKSPGSTEILLFHNRMSVGRIDGEQGEATIDIAQLGSGPIQIQAVGIVAGSPQDYVFAAPLDVQVQR